jgi:hypothetical protein
MWEVSTNGASGQENEEVERQPAEEEQPHRDTGDDKGTERTVFERFRSSFRRDWSSDVLRSRGGGRVRLIVLGDPRAG